MAESAAKWVRLTAGDEKSVVLAVDFDGTGRVDATFRELVRLFPESADVWQTALPSGASGADEHLRWWSPWPSGGRPVDAVLGYCAGGALALALANRVTEEQGERPRVVLFDPDEPTGAALVADCAHAVDGMTTLSAAERQEFHSEGNRLLRNRSSEDFRVLAEEVLELYGRASGTAFGRLGLDADLVDGLTALFRSYVAYLVAGAEQATRAGVAGAAVVLSRDTRAPDEAGVVVRVDVPRRDLLRSPVAAAETCRLLSR